MKMTIIAGLITGIIILVGAITFVGSSKSDVVYKTNQNYPTNESNKTYESPQPVKKTQQATVSENIKTPEPGDTAPRRVAIPKTATPVGKTVKASQREFTIIANKDEYTPSVIVVNELDLVIINLTATDEPQSLFIPALGVFKEIPKGKTQRISFQAYPAGNYEFYCRNCKSPAAGKLIVNK